MKHYMFIINWQPFAYHCLIFTFLWVLLVLCPLPFALCSRESLALNPCDTHLSLEDPKVY